jgi:hypothetical protein
VWQEMRSGEGSHLRESVLWWVEVEQQPFVARTRPL